MKGKLASYKINNKFLSMTSFFLTIVILVFVVSCSYKSRVRNTGEGTVVSDRLPENFTIHITYDATSSGANRLFESFATFNGNALVSAKKTFISKGGVEPIG
jgi:hypothetical protein